jgi:hypothetical protein
LAKFIWTPFTDSQATATYGSGAPITTRLMSSLLCHRAAARSILRQYSRQAAPLPTTSRASNRSFAICRHHDAALRSKKDSIRLHIRSLEESRRKITSAAALRHGHVDPPKPGEELHVTFIDKDGDTHEFEVAEGDNLLDIAQANDLEMEGKIHCVNRISIVSHSDRRMRRLLRMFDLPCYCTGRGYV